VPSIPLTPEEERQVLETIGVQRLDDLFSTVPPKIRENADFKFDLGDRLDSSGRGHTEHELRNFFLELSERNAYSPKVKHFLGGGIYDNIIPAIVGQLSNRGEFLTCYTPYQPEVAQGTLRVIFEFQTLISRLTAMDISNASMYDGPTATAEAVLMAQRLNGKERQGVLVCGSLGPDYKKVLNTLLQGHAALPEEIAWTNDGTVDLENLTEAIARTKPCAVVVPSPNYFGIIEPLDKIRTLIPKDCLFIVSVADASALSIFEPPGSFGADVVTGEAHQLGTPMLFGGPHIGFYAAKREYLRQMPGRLCGETTDIHGRLAYTLTLSTREQHIRRDKATSNICTNQGLIALRTAIYLSFLGKQGFRTLGETNFSLFDYLIKECESNGIPLKFKGGYHYREGVFEVPNLTLRFKNGVKEGIVPGIRLAEKFPKDEEFANSLLVTVNPKHTKNDVDHLVEVLSHD
jgi:glycine dehydrogenase subunit 1